MFCNLYFAHLLDHREIVQRSGNKKKPKAEHKLLFEPGPLVGRVVSMTLQAKF
jgi:hypothetical protein